MLQEQMEVFIYFFDIYYLLCEGLIEMRIRSLYQYDC